MTETKIHEILAVDDPDKLQKFLHNIKPLQKFSPDNKIPFETLEKLVSQYYLKYDCKIQFINVDYSKRFVQFNYSADIATIYPWHKLITIHAESMYELYAKISIGFFLYVQTGKIKRKRPHPEYGI